MATILEVQDNKMEKLSEYAEHLLSCGGKLMRCIEEMKEGIHERRPRKYEDEYYRYY